MKRVRHAGLVLLALGVFTLGAQASAPGTAGVQASSAVYGDSVAKKAPAKPSPKDVAKKKVVIKPCKGCKKTK